MTNDKANSTQQPGKNPGDRPQGECQPCRADCEAFESLVDSGWNVDQVPAAHRERAQKIFSIVRAAAHPHTDDQVAARLVDSTMARLGRSTSESIPGLTPDDEEALDAWQLADHRLNKVPASLRDRAAKIEAIGNLITAVPVASNESQLVGKLIDSTVARLDSDRAARVARGPLPFERAPGKRYKLSDLLSIAAMLTLGTAVIWPIVASGRSHMQQMACRGNLGSVATGMGMYSGDNQDRLPMATASLAGLPWWEVGTPERSNSANLYTLARSQYTTPQTLDCNGNPACRECEMTCQDKDWKSLPAVSYSFRVMFGGKNPMWKAASDVIILSDKSPVVMRAIKGETVYPGENSPNHGGRGQNVLALDGSSRFMTTPIMRSGDNMWLPRGIEAVLSQASKALQPGQRGVVEMRTTKSQMAPIKGIETPADENDSFVGP